MSTRHLLLLGILSALLEPHAVIGISIYAAAEGGSGGIDCYLSLTGNYKYFCKGSCTEGNILLKTDGETATKGPYSLNYKPGTGRNSEQGILTVRINDVTRKSSGRYVCALGNSQRADSDIEFEVMVTDVLKDSKDRFTRTETEGRTISAPCHRTNFKRGSKRFLCRDSCDKEEDIVIETEADHAERGRFSLEYKDDSTFGLYVTITNLKKSDQGWYKCGYGSALSPDWVTSFPVIVVAAPPPKTTTATTMKVATTTQTATTTTPTETTPMTTTKEATNAPSPTTTMATDVWTTTKVATTTQTPTTMETTPMTAAKETINPRLISSSGSSLSSSSSVLQQRGRFLLVVIFLSALGALLLAVGLVLLNRWRKNRNSRQAADVSGTEMPAIATQKFTPIPTCESSRD